MGLILHKFNNTKCRLLNDLEENSIVTIGKFDAIHKGHLALFSELFTKADDLNLYPVIVITDPNPASVLQKMQCINYDSRKLYPVTQRISIIKNLYANFTKGRLASKDLTIIIQKFSKDFASLDCITFIEDYLIKVLNVKSIVCNQDFKFGKDAKGSVSVLNKYFNTIVIKSAKHNLGSFDISTNDIKVLIKNGEVERANNLLTNPYFIVGRVVSGAKLARKLGFKTANIMLFADKYIVPSYGVYAVNALVDGIEYKAICNIGIKPSVASYQSQNPLLEVHILNFKDEIYGKKIAIEFIKFIRSEKKFANIQELKMQIEMDIEALSSNFSVKNIIKS